MIDPVAIGGAPQRAFDGRGYRHLGPRHDPLSGEGARIQGGRFNPPDSFPVLYLCLSRECAVAELRRLGQALSIGVDGVLPRKLFVYDVTVSRVLDLTDDDVLHALGVDATQIIADDRSLTCEIGVIADGLALQAVQSPSATGVGVVLALFPEHLGGAALDPRLAEEWQSATDL